MSTVMHKMTGDMEAACGADSWDLVISWENVTCDECRAFQP